MNSQFSVLVPAVYFNHDVPKVWYLLDEFFDLDAGVHVRNQRCVGGFVEDASSHFLEHLNVLCGLETRSVFINIQDFQHLLQLLQLCNIILPLLYLVPVLYSCVEPNLVLVELFHRHHSAYLVYLVLKQLCGYKQVGPSRRDVRIHLLHHAVAQETVLDASNHLLI